MFLRLINEAEEDIIDRLTDERPMDHEFPVNSVQNRLQVIALPRVFAVKQL